MLLHNGSGLIAHREDDVLTLKLNRPEAANALCPDLVEAMIQILGSEHGVRLCVIKAAGKNFCAGFDLSDIDTVSDGDLLWRFLRIEQLLQKIHHASFPTLVFVHGHVVGAGADIFAACWRRVAAPDARFRMPGWQFGLALGTRRLARLVGQDNARDMLIDTKVIDAGEALSINLATSVAKPDEWGDLEAAILNRARVLPTASLGEMLGLTTFDSRSDDIAAIVSTAGIPGLKQRILDYRERVHLAKSSKVSRRDKTRVTEE